MEQIEEIWEGEGRGSGERVGHNFDRRRSRSVPNNDFEFSNFSRISFK